MSSNLKIKKMENEFLKVRVKLIKAIGEKRFDNIMDSMNEWKEAIKLLVLSAEEKENGSGEKIENLLREISNSSFLHTSAVNGKPEKLIKALEELRDKISFA
ncbi:hypothetical protein IPF86_01875 [Candidatus Nomurabacteria bacterium]|nr:MAG: hypothetical protein IPF86_01875 [Candidatus Nomurabacteria bacterium]